jgi:4-hydroxybenzoate polyprenyltransferase
MSLWPYIRIARVDHWIKNLFVVPGVVLALYFDPTILRLGLWVDVLLGFIAVSLVASCNYVLNEILDAATDRHHPEKHLRPIPSGQVHLGLAWAEWLLLGAGGLALAFALNPRFGWTAVALAGMGIFYNVKPVRLKDLAYGDVLSESINNPIRLVMGWCLTGLNAAPPLSVFTAYWMFGAYLMAAKRFAEYRHIGDPERAALYRRSFATYTEKKLLTSMFYYGTLCALMLGYFIARYRFELVLATPLMAYAMAYYLHIAYKTNSAAQYPECLWGEKKLMATVGVLIVLIGGLLFIDLPMLRHWFDPLILPARPQ